jgi:cytochrome c peroxidase
MLKSQKNQDTDNMNTKLFSGLFLLVFMADLLVQSCATPAPALSPGEGLVKQYYNAQTDTLLARLSLLDSMTLLHKPVPELRDLFAESRFCYKKIEGITEYYFQGLTKRINGPALPDIKTEDGQVWPPHGFQMIEQYLYSEYSDSLVGALSNEIKLLQTDLRFTQANMEHNAILPRHAAEMVQHELIRVATLGISGFDAPLSKLSLPETEHSLTGLAEVFKAYFGDQLYSASLKSRLDEAVGYLQKNNDFDGFNRLEFLTGYLVPLSEAFAGQGTPAVGYDSLMVKPFRGTLANLLQGRGFDADYYAGYAHAKSTPQKVALGKALFYDKRLSQSGKLSCADCHQPNLFFTDGKAKADNFVHGGSLSRNTPTLYYSALQSHQFYDLRAVTLEDQIHQVMENSAEFNFSATAIAKKLFADRQYRALFQTAFSGKDTISGFEVRNALAAFVRSLSPFSSRFDAYMQGNPTAMNVTEIAGFNLFMGKAKCGTCHFMPLFNGNIPPWYVKSESEVIGVPAVVAIKNARIDPDSGRYKINAIPELLFAFKTPGIRNVAKTAPYMHNGAYKTLEQVVAFYHKGGGTGIGIDLPNQSLPFDSLVLNVQERNAIVEFMKTLTDEKLVY